MTRLMTVFAILFASVLLIGCAGAPKAPKGELCGINASSGYKLCFDFEKDFDANGKLKSEARGARSSITLQSLHKGWFLDASSKEELQAYAEKWKQRYLDLKKKCD